MRQAWGAAAVAAVGLLAGCGGGEPSAKEAAAEPETKTVTVKFHLEDYDTAFYGCEGAGGYADIGPGTSVTIKSGDGDVLGAAELGAGTPSSNGRQMAFCDWADVPAGEDFYVAEVGSRGEATSSGADLAAAGWTFELSLGQL